VKIDCGPILSKVKNLKLAKQGKLSYEWARSLNFDITFMESA